jgi:hypothetical protein
MEIFIFHICGQIYSLELDGDGIIDGTLDGGLDLLPQRIYYGHANMEHPEIWSNNMNNDNDGNAIYRRNSIFFSSNAHFDSSNAAGYYTVFLNFLMPSFGKCIFRHL